MWTLISQGKSLTCGLFPDQMSAEMWAAQHTAPQGLKLEPVELLLPSGQEAVIDGNQLYTDVMATDSIAGLPVC